MDQDTLRAAVGPGADYYLEKFEKIDRTGRAATWNWPAFFASSGWLVYRGMGGYAVLNFLLPAPFLLLMIGPARGTALAFLLLAAYLALAFVVIPLYANAFYYRHLQARITRAAAAGEADQKASRSPSALRGAGAVLTGALAFLVPAALIVAPAMYADYTPRAKVSDGIMSIFSVRQAIDEFYAEHKRFPTQQEAQTFRAEGSKYLRSAVYDAERRTIVITWGEESPFNGKRVALHAEEKDGAIYWRCRTIDLEKKYLPLTCRE